jgi:hypothetical protein
MESGDLLGFQWPNTGIYEYKITEIDESLSNFYNQDPDVFEEPKYSGAEYTLTVYVKEGVNDKGETVIYVYYAEGVVVTADTEDGAAEGEKVDPNPGGNGEDYTYSQIIFTNSYVKTNLIVDPTEDDGPLGISKEVTGIYGNKGYYFQFSLKVTAPTLSDVTGPFKGYIVEGTTVVDLDDADNPNTKSGTDTIGDYIEFTNGGAATFYLKDGQRIVFLDTPVGTSFTATETGVPGYVTKIDLHGDTIPGLTTGLQYVVDDNGSFAEYNNNNDGKTPTGLNLNDLPFYGLILLAFGGLIAFVAVKSRKRKATDR